MECSGDSGGDNTVVVGQAWRMLSCLASYRLEPLVFVYMLANTLILATSQNVCLELRFTMPQNLMMDRVCSVNLGLNASVCDNITSHANADDENRVQRLADQYVLYKNLIESAPGVLLALFLGSWSDTHGRRLPLLLPIAGTVLSCVVFIVFSAVDTLPAQYLLLAALPQAATGGITVFLMAAFSYVGDSTGQRDRTSRLAVLDVCFLAPVALGFIVSGQLVRNFGYTPLYSVSVSVNALVLLYGLLLVPESRSSSQLAASAVSIGAVISKSNVKRIVHTCFRRRHGYNRCTILLAMVGFAAHEMVFNGLTGIELPYVKRVLDWTFQDYSNFVAIVMGIGMFYNLVVLPLLSFVLGVRDSVIGVTGQALQMIGTGMRGFVHTTGLFYIATVIGLPGSLVTVSLRSIISKNVAKEELGVVFSFLSAITSVSSLATSSAFLLLYNAVLDHGPGLVFLIAAAFSSPALVALGVCTVLEVRGQMGYAQVLSEQEEQEDQQDADTMSDDVDIFQSH